jgi:hypothetical protein
MKAHAALWWENLHNDREKQGKDNIKMRKNILKHLKMNFIPSDYRQLFFREYQNLRKKELSVPSFTE